MKLAPDFPFLEDEIAEPRQYMNIKVVACIHVFCLINILQCPLLTLVMPNSFMIYNPLKFLFCKPASWQSFCPRLWIDLSLLMFHRQYLQPEDPDQMASLEASWSESTVYVVNIHFC